MPTPKSNGVALNKKHAIVHTATIDVKIMRLDGKQVSLSVFRQLDSESVFNCDGTLRGVIWGRVNYTWGERGGKKSRIDYYVVWQEGEYLKRSPVPIVEDGFSPKPHEFGDGIAWGRWLMAWTNGRGLPPAPERFIDSPEEYDEWSKAYEEWQSQSCTVIHKVKGVMLACRKLDQLFIAV